MMGTKHSQSSDSILVRFTGAPTSEGRRRMTGAAKSPDRLMRLPSGSRTRQLGPGQIIQRERETYKERCQSGSGGQLLCRRPQQVSFQQYSACSECWSVPTCFTSGFMTVNISLMQRLFSSVAPPYRLPPQRNVCITLPFPLNFSAIRFL